MNCYNPFYKHNNSVFVFCPNNSFCPEGDRNMALETSRSLYNDGVVINPEIVQLLTTAIEVCKLRTKFLFCTHQNAF